MTPTSEQSAITALTSVPGGNLMIDALAGCGKTSTLELIERATKVKPILYLVFSAKNRDEATEKMLSTTTVRNFNGLGHRVWAEHRMKKLSLNKKKTNDILIDLIKSSPRNAQGPLWDSLWSVINGVGLAKALGYVPEGKYPNAKRLCTQSEFHAELEETPDDLIADLIDEVLHRSIRQAYDGIIDFNDQIYMPTLFGGAFPRFPIAMVDEYQDLNPTNHAMIGCLMKSGDTRLIGVGDPWQNIYAFRGAKAQGMREAVDTYKMDRCSLSVSFRCPQAVVENARWRVPHFKWLKPGGRVEHLKSLDPRTIPDDVGIICRNNAPLFKLALNLLASGRSVSVAGSDIGPKLLAQMKKLGDGDMSQASVYSAIDDWLSEKLVKGSTTAEDVAQCMTVFAGFGASLSEAIAVAQHLFNQRGAIRLLTGHKSKGLEFPCVYHLDPHLLRSDEQDLNLRYVIQTRALESYYEINSTDIIW